ncbi:hypothetical protein SAMN05444397_10530 [Flavobacterium aquidurense]|nr:hypothetical protein SAMN05444397_10530 [Flavobacterium aquidurense]
MLLLFTLNIINHVLYVASSITDTSYQNNSLIIQSESES